MGESFVTFCTLICFIFIYKCVAIDLDDIDLPDCSDGSSCIEPTSSIESNDVPTEKSQTAEFGSSTESFIDIIKNIETMSTTTEVTKTPFTTTPIPTTTIKNDLQKTIGFKSTKSSTEVCTCDIKISSCDVNCCCDPDCSDFQIAVFSHCVNHRVKKYDSRYCYTQNFIQRNNTQFILERLANNLFCIAYDNLPPVYGMNEVPDLTDRQIFEKAKNSVNRKQFTWKWNDNLSSTEFNFSSHYRDNDDVWMLFDDDVEIMKLPKSGFTSQCTFQKNVKYLEASQWECMQTDLNNNNSYLFSEIYTNLMIISSPHLFNLSYLTSNNHTCPKDICLSPRTLYCSETWTDCNVTKPLKQSCSNNNCENVVKKIRYTFFHNGTNGIRSAEARIALTNVSQHFYQHFEIQFEWITEWRGEKFLRSGNPGYIIGKPILIGNLVTNVTNEIPNEHIGINISNYYLTLPMRGKNPNCESEQRYRVGFGENVRLQCSVQKTTNNFSSSTCMELQNETLRFMMQNSLHGISEVEKYKIYVSKNGDLSKNNLTDWVQILLDKIPHNVVTGQVLRKKIRCSALVTSLHIEVLYTILPSHEETDHFKIAGVALTFSDPKDFTWKKCSGANCSDILEVQLMSFVTFTDISTPSMYYYAGGPNLDITLPYDFFYPFMSNSRVNEPCYFLVALFLIFLSNS